MRVLDRRAVCAGHTKWVFADLDLVVEGGRCRWLASGGTDCREGEVEPVEMEEDGAMGSACHLTALSSLTVLSEPIYGDNSSVNQLQLPQPAAKKAHLGFGP